MKFIVPFIIVAAAVVQLQLAAAVEIECYWCFGYRYDRNESKYTNTKDCTLDSFNKDGAATIRNATSDEGYDLACVTASLWIKGWNKDEPVTARGAIKYKIPQRPADMDVLDTGLFDEEIVDLATKRPETPLYFGTEVCFQDLCNTHTYHGGAASHLDVSRVFFLLLLLPSVTLRYLTQ